MYAKLTAISPEGTSNTLIDYHLVNNDNLKIPAEYKEWSDWSIYWEYTTLTQRQIDLSYVSIPLY